MPDSDESGSDDDLGISEADAQALLADSTDQSGTSDTDSDDGSSKRIADLEREAAKWRELARKHEGRAKQNAAAATESKTLQQQLDELRGQFSERDAADLERNGKLALSQVHTRLAESGITRADVAGLLELVDPQGLLADGQPDDKAVEKLASSLLKVAGRASPDPDQGKRGGSAPADMNTLIRRAAGVIT